MSKIIILNGCSSSGKTSVAKELIAKHPTPFLRLSSDQLIDGGILPNIDRIDKNSPFYWHKIRKKFFAGFHLHIKAFADADNDVVVDHIIEFSSWYEDLKELLKNHETYFIGIHCDLKKLEEREMQRGDRTIGEARSHLLEDKIHDIVNYDFEIDTTNLSALDAANEILSILPVTISSKI